MKAKWTVMIYMAGDNNLDSAESIFKPDAPAYVYREYKRGVTTRF
jgi:hypothetical protein